MDLPPAPVLLTALFVILFALFGRHRSARPRQLADIGGFMSSSYAADGDGPDGDVVPGGWLPPASEGWPAARHVWADTGTWPTEPIVVEPAPAAPPPPEASAAHPAAAEPFEYPAPTSLEQRGVPIDAVGELDEIDDLDDDDWDDAIDDDAHDLEATPEMTNETDPAETPAEPAPPALHAVARSSRGRDPLTGMLDPDAFEEVMAQEDAREQRYGHPATVIVFELDGLAKLVDRLGAEPGDRIEVALADTITRLARRADHVARLDRGRYAVLLPETDEVAAINYIERIRRACDLWLESGAIAMRLSIGWASTNGDAGLNGAIRVASDRLRQEQRRNSRGVGDTVPDLELLENEAPTEAAAGQ
jgi:diguanylate cyclase (GGDEF)-like protein